MNDYIILDGKRYRTSHPDWEPTEERPMVVRRLMSGKTNVTFGPATFTGWSGVVTAEVGAVAPYGTPDKMSQEAFRVACLAGYEGVCSAYGAYNFPGQDPFHIRRIHADLEFVRFKNWMTFDPRKLRQRDSFDPGDYRLPDPDADEVVE